MTRTLAWTAMLGVLVCAFTVGCDMPPGPPAAANNKIPKTLTVTPGDQAEPRK